MPALARWARSLTDLVIPTKFNRSANFITGTIKFPSANILVARNGIYAFDQLNGDALYSEQCQFPRDTKAFMYGRVVNKKARHNLCFSDMDQQPDYASGKGTVINFTRTPILNHIRINLPIVTGIPKLGKLQCEANYYYDIKKCGIGFHGDGERKKVVAFRMGASMPLYYQWYQNSKPVGDRFVIELNDGDMYIMSEKVESIIKKDLSTEDINKLIFEYKGEIDLINKKIDHFFSYFF